MKKFFYLAAVLPMMLLASCEKEATVNTLTATATVAGDNDTKTTYTDNGKDTQSALKVSWSDAESFKAYYSSTEFVTFSKTSGNTFTAADVPAGVTSSTQFTGVYGTKATYKSDGTISIDFSGQDGSLENLGKYDVMTCTSTTEAGALKFAFEHKCAIIRATLAHTAKFGGTSYDQLKLTFYHATLGGGLVASNITGLSFYTGSKSVSMNITIPGTAWVDATGADGNAYKKAVIYFAVPPLDYVSSGTDGTGASNGSINRVVNLYSSIEAGKLYDLTATNSTIRGFKW